MTMLLVTAEFAKSFVAAHTRLLSSGKVIRVGAYSDKRTKHTEAVDDGHTPDMFGGGAAPKIKPVAPVQKKDYEERKNMKLLWSESEPQTKEDGQPSAFAADDTDVSSGDSPNAITQSGSSVPQAATESKPDSTPSSPLGDALKRGDLSGAMRILEPLDKQEAGRLMLMSGFRMPYAKTKKDLMSFVQNQLIEASNKKTDGYGLRDKLTKSLPTILFFKSHVKQYVRKDGVEVKEHDDKRIARVKVKGPGRKPAAPPEGNASAKDAEDLRGSAHGYGTHNIEEGDSIKFKAGDFEGAGKVKSVGADGATVTDESGRDHAVHWHEVAGFKRADGGGDKPPVDYPEAQHA